MPLPLDVTDAAAAGGGDRDSPPNGSAASTSSSTTPGYANVSPIETGDDEDFRAQFETNFWGVYNVSKAAIPALREQGGGLIMQFSSMGGRVGGSPGIASYQAAKVRDRRVQPRAADRDGAVRHQGDRRRAERVSRPTGQGHR